MPTIPDFLRQAADLLDRRPELKPLSVSARIDGAEIHLRDLPADGCDVVTDPWHQYNDTMESQHTRCTIEGVRFVFVELRDIAPVSA